MQHPYEKLIKIEWLMIALACLTGLIAIIKNYFILLILALLFTGLSLLFGAMAAHLVRYHANAVKQMIRSILIFLLLVLLFFVL